MRTLCKQSNNICAKSSGDASDTRAEACKKFAKKTSSSTCRQGANCNFSMKSSEVYFQLWWGAIMFFLQQWELHLPSIYSYLPPSKEREMCFTWRKRDKVVNSAARRSLPRCCRGDVTWLYLQSPSSSFPFSHPCDTLTRATFHLLESRGICFLPQLVQELGSWSILFWKTRNSRPWRAFPLTEGLSFCLRVEKCKHSWPR